MTTTVGPTWASVNIDCADSAGQADFWGSARFDRDLEAFYEI